MKHNDVIRQYDDGAMLIRMKQAGELGRCEVCGQSRPGLYLTGQSPFLCTEHADRIDDGGGAVG
jgi:hypothetical protein